MNDFFFWVSDEVERFTVIYVDDHSVRATWSQPYYIRDENYDIFKCMCEKPAMAIMYLGYDDGGIRLLAKMILPCKKTIRIKQLGEYDE